MNYYNGLNSGNNLHTVRVTFQFEEYKGHIAFEMGGNCHGIDLLEFNPCCINDDDVSRFVENDCSFKYNEESDLYSLKLTNDNGDTNDIDCLDNELSDCVVAIEIIKCVPEVE